MPGPAHDNHFNQIHADSPEPEPTNCYAILIRTIGGSECGLIHITQHAHIHILSHKQLMASAKASAMMTIRWAVINLV